MRLLVDMNLTPRWIQVLEAAGYESAHWSTIGAHDAPDSVIMAHAAHHDCVVLTHDLDFGAILAATHGEKPSVVQIRAVDVTPEAIGLQVIATLRQVAAELEQGALVVLDATRSRLRLLPLRSKP
jgi:predicted nuclease of predicted toxin-antitoxin system